MKPKQEEDMLCTGSGTLIPFLVASCFRWDKLPVVAMLLMLAATKQTGIRTGGRNERHVLANVSNVCTTCALLQGFQ